ncbi:MAG: cyclic nucleotide-binding domain-containing protein [Candidatus Riflebacteria bacterium]|nr:cyclic nucleotide-binding domain-containing protein [Candidatus Riflebacteria bacterium]
MKKVLIILGELADSDIEWLMRNGRKRKISRGTVLVTEGKQIESLYIVLEGMFSITVKALKNREVARIGVGEVLGEMSCIDSRPPSATVTSVTDSVVLDITRSDLMKSLKSDLPFAARFYRAMAVFLSDRLRGTMNRFGYGEDEPLDEDKEYEDELDSGVLDNVALAGARFEGILHRLRGN